MIIPLQKLDMSFTRFKLADSFFLLMTTSNKTELKESLNFLMFTY